MKLSTVLNKMTSAGYSRAQAVLGFRVAAGVETAEQVLNVGCFRKSRLISREDLMASLVYISQNFT